MMTAKINSFVLELECGCSCRVVISYGPQIVLFRDLKEKKINHRYEIERNHQNEYEIEIRRIPPTSN